MTNYLKKPVLIAIACGSLLLGTGCADDQLAKGILPKALLVGAGVVAGALVGGAVSPDDKTTGMFAGAAIGGGIPALAMAAGLINI